MVVLGAFHLPTDSRMSRIIGCKWNTGLPINEDKWRLVKSFERTKKRLEHGHVKPWLDTIWNSQGQMFVGKTYHFTHEPHMNFMGLNPGSFVLPSFPHPLSPFPFFFHFISVYNACLHNTIEHTPINCLFYRLL